MMSAATEEPMDVDVDSISTQAVPVAAVSASAPSGSKKGNVLNTTPINFSEWELPKAGINRCLRQALPGRPTHKDLKTALTRAGTVFVSFLTATCQDVARERSHSSNRTLTQAHVQEALRRLGFADFLDTINERIELDNSGSRKKRPGKKAKEASSPEVDVVNDNAGEEYGEEEEEDEMDEEEEDDEDMPRESELPSLTQSMQSVPTYPAVSSSGDDYAANDDAGSQQDERSFHSDSENNEFLQDEEHTDAQETMSVDEEEELAENL